MRKLFMLLALLVVFGFASESFAQMQGYTDTATTYFKKVKASYIPGQAGYSYDFGINSTVADTLYVAISDTTKPMLIITGPALRPYIWEHLYSPGYIWIKNITNTSAPAHTVPVNYYVIRRLNGY